MWFPSVLNSLKIVTARAMARRVRREARHKKPAATRLILEALEDRCLLSAISLVPSEAAPPLAPTGFSGCNA